MHRLFYILPFLALSCSSERNLTFIGEWTITQSSYHDCDDIAENFIINYDETGTFCEEGFGILFCITTQYLITDTTFTIINQSQVSQTPTISDTLTGTYTFDHNYNIQICLDGICKNGLFNLFEGRFTIQLDADEGTGCVETFSADRIP